MISWVSPTCSHLGSLERRNYNAHRGQCRSCGASTAAGMGFPALTVFRHQKAFLAPVSAGDSQEALSSSDRAASSLKAVSSNHPTTSGARWHFGPKRLNSTVCVQKNEHSFNLISCRMERRHRSAIWAHCFGKACLWLCAVEPSCDPLMQADWPVYQGPQETSWLASFIFRKCPQPRQAFLYQLLGEPWLSFLSKGCQFQTRSRDQHEI